MSRFTRVNFALSLVMIVGFLSVLFLGVYDFFPNKAVLFDASILFIVGSSVTAILGFGLLIFDYAKAVAPEWMDNG